MGDSCINNYNQQDKSYSEVYTKHSKTLGEERSWLEKSGIRIHRGKSIWAETYRSQSLAGSGASNWAVGEGILDPGLRKTCRWNLWGFIPSNTWPMTHRTDTSVWGKPTVRPPQTALSMVGVCSDWSRERGREFALTASMVGRAWGSCLPIQAKWREARSGAIVVWSGCEPWWGSRGNRHPLCCKPQIWTDSNFQLCSWPPTFPPSRNVVQPFTQTNLKAGRWI